MALDDELLNREEAPAEQPGSSGGAEGGASGGAEQSDDRSGQMREAQMEKKRAAQEAGKKVGQEVGKQAAKAAAVELTPVGQAIAGQIGKKVGGMIGKKAGGIVGEEMQIGEALFGKFGKYILPVIPFCAPCCFMVFAGLIILLIFTKVVSDPFAVFGAVIKYVLSAIGINISTSSF